MKNLPFFLHMALFDWVCHKQHECKNLHSSKRTTLDWLSLEDNTVGNLVRDRENLNQGEPQEERLPFEPWFLLPPSGENKDYITNNNNNSIPFSNVLHTNPYWKKQNRISHIHVHMLCSETWCSLMSPDHLWDVSTAWLKPNCGKSSFFLFIKTHGSWQ